MVGQLAARLCKTPTRSAQPKMRYFVAQSPGTLVGTSGERDRKGLGCVVVVTEFQTLKYRELAALNQPPYCTGAVLGHDKPVLRAFSSALAIKIVSTTVPQ